MSTHSICILHILLISLAFQSCEKKADYAKAKITVQTTSGELTEGAKVQFYINTTPAGKRFVDTILITNSKGEVEYIRSRDCVLDVFVKKVIGSTALVGSSVIFMKQDEIVYDTIIVN